jgi:hypothetical protein
MKRTASETVGVGAARISKRSRTGVRFYAVDGTLCLLLEAESEEDAAFLCRDVRLEFVGLCRK